MGYTIKAGDTLTKIAKQYGTTVSELARLNNIKNVNVIFAGRTLKLKDDTPKMSTSDAIAMLNQTQKNSESQTITAENSVEQTDTSKLFQKDTNPPTNIEVNNDFGTGIAKENINGNEIYVVRHFDGTVNRYEQHAKLENGGTSTTIRNAQGELESYIEGNSDGKKTKEIQRKETGGYEEKLFDESGLMTTLTHLDANSNMVSKLNYEAILDDKGARIGSRLVSEENANGTVIHEDTNYEAVLDQKESRIGWRKTPEPKQQINDPRFKGLEDYEFEIHGSKEGVGAITVNGEKMLISTDGNIYSLTRYEMKDGTITNMHNMPDYSSLDELKKALTDKNNKFGQYSGINTLDDVFIP